MIMCACGLCASAEGFTVRTVDPVDLPESVTDYMEEQFLRDMSDGAQTKVLMDMAWTAMQAAEDKTDGALMPQTWQQIMAGFPWCGQIRVQRPPFIGVTSLQYYDGDNVSHELAGSPQGFVVVPSGQFSRATLRAVDGETFPQTYSRPDAVTLTFRAGFRNEEAPVFKRIVQGMLLMVGELNKLRSLSVHEVHNTPSVLNLGHFWRLFP